MTKPLFTEDEIDFIKDLDDRLRRLERSIAIEPWHNVGTVGEPAFQNGWTNLDARVARFYRANGRIYLEGIISNGTIDQPAFTLPAGYRPTQAGIARLIWPVTSNNLFGVVSVYPDGRVVPTTPVSNVYVDVSPVSFRCL